MVKTLKRIKKNGFFYVLLIPCLIYAALFFYAPLYGIQLAFKNFNPQAGITGSEWADPLFLHFETFFSSYQFWGMIQNTLTLSLYLLIAGFPIPVFLALLLNYNTSLKLKKITQTITYAPHFISTVVMAGMLIILLSPTGVLNQLIQKLGAEPVLFFGKPEYFKHIYVWSDIWQHMGWNSVIYIAALASVSPDLHEAAIVDGASKFKRIWHIDLPALIPMMVIVLILNMGTVLNLGFEKVFLLQNSINIEVSEIISTYVYKVGLINTQYSYSTAIGLFNNAISFLLILVTNSLSKKGTGTGLW